jgi:hypothetical protein
LEATIKAFDGGKDLVTKGKKMIDGREYSFTSTRGTFEGDIPYKELVEILKKGTVLPVLVQDTCTA